MRKPYSVSKSSETLCKLQLHYARTNWTLQWMNQPNTKWSLILFCFKGNGSLILYIYTWIERRAIKLSSSGNFVWLVFGVATGSGSTSCCPPCCGCWCSTTDPASRRRPASASWPRPRPSRRRGRAPRRPAAPSSHRARPWRQRPWPTATCTCASNSATSRGWHPCSAVGKHQLLDVLVLGVGARRDDL